MLKLRLPILSTITVTCGSEMYFFIDSREDFLQLQRGITGGLDISRQGARKSCRQGGPARSSTCPVLSRRKSTAHPQRQSRMSPERTPVAAWDVVSAAVGWAGLAVAGGAVGAELPASWATPSLPKLPSRSIDCSNRTVKISTPVSFSASAFRSPSIRVQGFTPAYHLLPCSAEAAARRWGIPTSFSLYNSAR